MSWVISLGLKLLPGLKNWKLILVMALIAGSAWISWWGRGVLAEADKARALEHAIEQAEKLAKVDQSIYETQSEVVHDIKVRYVEIERKAEDVATPDCVRLGGSFLGVYNSAIED